MARLFTISFSYNEEWYSTLVTVKTTPYYIEYTLNNLNAALLRLLPGNKIISPTPKNFLFPNANAEHSIRLMNTIIKAVSLHLQTVNT
jgi:hypothetical protein